eukprot:NODE_1895_length_1040_cov_105.522704_g1539_i0.p1 GENE.NODE_1895_length_1040_cov_105.522704_g1539_i0~~NODE_1895_length_1040_cov_105.522704_g1539_i0.p1  ORF type:complete len:307 (-),score=55.20 NODE_1895_length_1040_cov_105.522704_g1539_i0:74-994(-)
MRAAVAVVGLASSANAWWNNGHMFTARVAYDVLAEQRPELLAKAEGILANLAEFTQLETAEHAFVECATFPDKIKHRGFGAQAHWHFIDTPILDGIEKDIPKNPWNVVWAINQMKYDLKYAKPAGNPTKGPNVDDTFTTSMDLRFLIHYVGDVHQPLHASDRYAPNHPNGDYGGNAFLLAKTHGIDELHALWDSIVMFHKSDFSEPLSDFHWKETGEISAELRKEFPMESYGDALLATPQVWADESYHIASTFVYNGLTEGEWPSDEYMTKGQLIAKERVVKGGYRLALTLIDLWTGVDEEKVVEE